MRTYEATYKHEAVKLAEEIGATKAAKELLRRQLRRWAKPASLHINRSAMPASHTGLDSLIACSFFLFGKHTRIGRAQLGDERVFIFVLLLHILCSFFHLCVFV